MATQLLIRAIVLPGHRLELTVPDAPVGTPVEVVVTLPETEGVRDSGSELRAFLKSLPPNRRTPAEWAEFDRQFQGEREAWDR